VGVCFAVGPIAGTARAEAPAPAVDDHEQERTALYRQGVALAEAGQWAEALKKFQAVVAIRSAPAALVAMATAQEKLGALATARRTYSRAHDDARAIGDQALAEKASAKFAALQSRVPRLAIRLSTMSLTAAVVTIDGDRVLPSADGDVEVDPGEHRVVVTTAGQLPYEQRAQVAEAERKELSVDFAPIPPKESAAPSSGPPLGALILGGAGIATAAIGAIVYANALSTYNAGKDAQSCRDPSCVDKVNQGNDARATVLASSIVTLTGIAAIGGAGVWWLFSPRAHDSSQGTTSATHVSVGPTRGGYWVQLEGAF
jgi:tetratricopeptide (TPR) repeat protein